MPTKILVVDNNPIFLRLMTSYFDKTGYQVILAENGYAALEVLKSFTPDIAFIDLVMPLINGKKLCKLVRKAPRYKDMSIVILSAAAAEEEEDFHSYGADYCIAKGQFKNTAEHITAVIDDILSGKKTSLSRKVLGLGDVQPSQVTKELLQTERHFEFIINNLPNGLVELDQYGKIIYLNKVFEVMSGLVEEEILGQDFSDLFSAEDRQFIDQQLSAVQSEWSTDAGSNQKLTINGLSVTVKIKTTFEDGKKTFMVIVA